MSRTGQPLRFLGVGTAGYLVNVGLFAAVVARPVPYVLASALAYLVANALMYVGNRYLTFRLGHAGFWSAYARYLIVGIVVVVLSGAVLAALVELFGLDPLLAQPLSLLIVFPVAFVLFKRWTFGLR